MLACSWLTWFITSSRGGGGGDSLRSSLGEEPRKGSGTLTAAKEGDLSGEYIARVALHCQIPKLHTSGEQNEVN